MSSAQFKDIKYIVQYRGFEFVIKSNNGFYTIYSNDGNTFNWLDKLNYRIMKNRYNIDQIKNILSGICEKYCGIVSKDKLEIKDTIIQTNKFDIEHECAKELNLLRSCAGESMKKYSLDPNALRMEKDKKIKIFDRKQCSEIIITDYMKIFRDIKNEDGKLKGTIDIIDGYIYDWTIRLKCFNEKINNELEILSEKYVVINFKFHPDYHPSYPPVITVVYPNFKNNLNNKITRSKYTNLEYWNYERTPYDILIRTVEIINKYGEIDTGNYNYVSKYNPETQKLIDHISQLLINVSTMVDFDEHNEIDTDQKFVRILDSFRRNIRKNRKLDNGIGYGYAGANSWDPSEYEKIMRERNMRFVSLINNLIEYINIISDKENGDLSCIILVLKNSILFKYILKLFKNCTILEITNNSSYYRSIFDLIQILCLESSIEIFHDDDNNKCLFNHIVLLYNKAQTCLEISNDNEIANIIAIIYSMLENPYGTYLSNIKKDSKKLIHHLESNNKCNELITKYLNVMNKYKYTIGNNLHNYDNYYFKNIVLSEDVSMMRGCYKRMSSEIATLMESQVISDSAIVLIYVDRVKPNCIRYILSGPTDTPYARGLFMFDSYCGQQYPTISPEFHFLNTGGFRFNPNLYSEGKVCLSLLGTYIGPEPYESEKWNPRMSTLHQVIISIQSQILIDQPYFNEPGYEKDKGTQRGNNASREYNESVQYATIKVGMVDIIENANKYPQFKNAIYAYFYLQKENIVVQCEEWIRKCNNANYKREMNIHFDHLKELLRNIKFQEL